jgi:hypothetical protein
MEKIAAKRLPETDEERIDVLRAALEQEETNEAWDKILSIMELQELRVFTTAFEGANSILNQAIMDRNKAQNLYDELFKNVQLYVSHFIQVLFLTVIRNEIKSEYLNVYGFQENNPVLPDLSTEEAVLSWAEKLMRGETERTYRGGIPLYNPAIAKVKVHYELFKEVIYSLAIYEKNLVRLQNNMGDLRKKANDLIWDIWTKVEERYSRTSPDEQALRFKAYRIQSLYRKGEQLNVFDL